MKKIRFFLIFLNDQMDFWNTLISLKTKKNMPQKFFLEKKNRPKTTFLAFFKAK